MTSEESLKAQAVVDRVNQLKFPPTQYQHREENFGMTKEEFVLQRKIDRLLELLAAVGIDPEIAKVAMTNPGLIQHIRDGGKLPELRYCPVCDRPLPLFGHKPPTLDDLERALEEAAPTFSCEGCGLGSHLR